MKRLITLAFLCAASVASAAVAVGDFKLSQAVSASPATFADRLLTPDSGTAFTTMAGFRTAIGLAASTTDNGVPRYDGLLGKTQTSGIVIEDTSGNNTTIGGVDATTDVTVRGGLAGATIALGRAATGGITLTAAGTNTDIDEKPAGTGFSTVTKSPTTGTIFRRDKNGNTEGFYTAHNGSNSGIVPTAPANAVIIGASYVTGGAFRPLVLATSDVSAFELAINGDATAKKFFSSAGGFKITGSAFNKTTSTALADVTSLSCSLNATATYGFRAVLFVDADAVGGEKFAVAVSSAPTSIIYQINSIANATNANVINSRQTASGGSAGTAAATAYYTEIVGSVVTNAAATFTIQFAQNVSNGTSTVVAGSTLQVFLY